MQEHDEKEREKLYPLQREPYAHPNDSNLHIYPEKRDREPWAEQYELQWLDKSPKTTRENRKEELALRELNTNA